MSDLILPKESDFPEQNTREDDEEKPVKTTRRLSDEDKKMFNPSLDPYDMPLRWWESEHVKYAISYTPVRFRLLSLMKSDIVRLTDRKYIVQLATRIQEDREKKQRARIEERKIPLPTAIGRLLEMSDKVFQERLTHKPPRQRTITIQED